MWGWSTLVAVLVLAVVWFMLADSEMSPRLSCDMVEFRSGDQSSPSSSKMEGEVCRETLDQWRAEQEPVK